MGSNSTLCVDTTDVIKKKKIYGAHSMTGLSKFFQELGEIMKRRLTLAGRAGRKQNQARFFDVNEALG